MSDTENLKKIGLTIGAELLKWHGKENRIHFGSPVGAHVGPGGLAIVLRRDWLTRVADKGMAIVDGRLVLSAKVNKKQSQAFAADVYEVRALWLPSINNPPLCVEDTWVVGFGGIFGAHMRLKIAYGRVIERFERALL